MGNPVSSSPLMGEERVGVIRVRNIEIFHFDPPHPAPLPHGEREFQMDPF
jgi:hypothetical protein